MSNDGASLGVKTKRSLETILGGKEQPSQEEKMTPEQMYAELMSQPDNYKDVKYGYDENSLWLGKQFLLLLESGIEGDYCFLYDEMEKKNGEQNYGFTGFMVGWANNAARFALKRKSQPNPAIVTLD